jgi:hypothetical protein
MSILTRPRPARADDPSDVEALEALIEEARQRARRRRRGYAACALVAAAAGCLDGSYLRILPMFFGTDKIRFRVTSVRFPGETRTYDRFSRALREIIDARIWLGLHYRTADVQAQILGKKVAHYTTKHYFQPLD